MPAHAPGLGSVQQLQGDLRLGLEDEILGDLGLLAAVGILSPVFGHIEPGGDRPGDGPFGIMTVDGDLTVAGLAQGAGEFLLMPALTRGPGPSWRSLGGMLAFSRAWIAVELMWAEDTPQIG